MAEEVKSIPKHQMNDIFSKLYRSSFSIPVMTMIAGVVPHKEPYYVYTATIKFPVEIHIISKILFPELVRSERELDGEKGDNCKGSHNFLSAIIPYLTECILQGGFSR